MAPIAVEQTSTNTSLESLKAAAAKLTISEVVAEDLTKYAQFDTTPSIGTEFRTASTSKDTRAILDIRDVLKDESKLKALGRLVSERGVVFFRDAIITPEEQLFLVDRLGRHGGKPADSTLHVHPATLPGSEYGDEITTVSNNYVFNDKFKIDPTEFNRNRELAKREWHSDVTFEPNPSDYATLQIRTLPKVGGDTLWASAYEAYDRLSPALQTFLEGLTAVHVGQSFLDLSRKLNIPLRQERGSPHNVGNDLTAVHPVIRTNPVTGWKGLFVNRVFTTRIVELTKAESDILLDFLFDQVSANHDLQTRFRWEENSLAIWDNRSTFHAATRDLELQTREGTRSVSVGEAPFFDPNSVSRTAALKAKAQA